MRVFTILITTSFVLACSNLFAADDSVNWDYEGEEGPEYWGELSDGFSLCLDGKNQSPIDLTGQLDADLPELDFDYAHRGHLAEQNTGHAIQENVQPGNFLRVKGQAYELKQFHFHSPSEHTVNGATYPMEVHFVHQNEKGDLMVVGLMFKLGERNEIMDQLPTFRVARGEDPDFEGINYNDLVLERSKYFYYNGSLTTPPCSEGVRWVVMQKPIEVSEDQVKHIRDQLGFDNNRPLQALNARVVLE